MIAPVYEQLSRDFPDVRFYKVDIDKDQVSSSVAASNVSAVVRGSPHIQSHKVFFAASHDSVAQHCRQFLYTLLSCIWPKHI